MYPAVDGRALFFAMAKKSDPAMCAECEQLWKNYGDVSLKRVRAYGNLKLANLRNYSETMEMLVEGAARATQRLEEVRRIQNPSTSSKPSKNLSTRPGSDESDEKVPSETVAS